MKRLMARLSQNKSATEDEQFSHGSRKNRAPVGSTDFAHRRRSRIYFGDGSPNDDIDMIAERIRQTAALAVMVKFSQRRKDGSIFSVTQKTLLKDLLSGHGLSAADQETDVERHYRFDLCDGILVFALQIPGAVSVPKGGWPEEGFITTEVEGTRVYCLPYSAKAERTWQEEAATLVSDLKAAVASNGSEMKLQIGAARMVETLLELPEAYREARQAYNHRQHD